MNDMVLCWDLIWDHGYIVKGMMRWDEMISTALPFEAFGVGGNNSFHFISSFVHRIAYFVA